MFFLDISKCSVSLSALLVNTEYLYSLLEMMMTSYPAVMLVLAVLIADIKCVSPVSLL